MGDKTIITCAVTGNLTRPEQHPNLPITPKQIAAAALGAAAAGAAIVHLHVRDPETGRGSMKCELYEEVVSRIREENEDVILNLTTGEGGRYVPSDENPAVAGPGTTLCNPALRVAHVEQLQPEICTLDFNTMWSGAAAVINSPRNLEIMAKRIYAAGVLPEFEIFDSGDLQLIKHFLKEGILTDRFMVQMVLGVRFGASASSTTLQYLVSQLPPGSVWAAFGIGRQPRPPLPLVPPWLPRHGPRLPRRVDPLPLRGRDRALCPPLGQSGLLYRLGRLPPPLEPTERRRRGCRVPLE